MVILILCSVLALFTAFTDNSASEEERAYNEAVGTAEDYMRRGLYRLAIQKYDEAKDLRDTEELRSTIFSAYDKELEENANILTEYIEAAQDAVGTYNTNVDFALRLSELHELGKDYDSAYRCMEDIQKTQAEDPRIEQRMKQIRYGFDTDWSSYVKITPHCNGIYAVKDETDWSYIGTSGDQDIEEHFLFASRVGEDGIRLVYDGTRTFLLDGDKIKRGITSVIPEAAGVYSEGRIAICQNGTYGYYSQLGDYIFGSYLYAGAFQNGRAAVRTAENQWQIIDPDGEPVLTFEEIKLSLADEYLVRDRFLAKQSGQYKLYQADGAALEGFACDDVDVLTEDGLTAFRKNEKWGFVNLDGEVVIEPAYEEARSFSCGLAAVRKDGKWGFIDPENELVIDYQFDDADYFNPDGRCFVFALTPQYSGPEDELGFDSEDVDWTDLWEETGETQDTENTDETAEPTEPEESGAEETPEEPEEPILGTWYMISLHIQKKD